MERGSSPQSWRASYLCSPVPRMGAWLPALSVAPRKTGAAAAAPAVTRKLRRVTFMWTLLIDQVALHPGHPEGLQSRRILRVADQDFPSDGIAYITGRISNC